MRVKKVLKRELASNRKYKTTYKDIRHYFKVLNKALFKNILQPFNEIQIKKIYKDESKKFCYGQVTTWIWERKGTQQFWLEIWQMNIKGDTGNHNKLFYSFRPKLNKLGLDL